MRHTLAIMMIIVIKMVRMVSLFMSVYKTVYRTEHAIEAYLPVEEAFILVERKEYKHGFAYDMILGNKSPVARVGRFVTIVAQHHVIIHFEGVGIGFFSIDIDFAVFDLQVVVFVVSDRPLVNGQIFKGKFERSPFLGNPHRAVIGAGPSV